MGGFVVDLSNQWRMVVNTQFSVCSLEQLFRASVTDSRAHESRKFVAEGRVQLQQAMARTETRISRFSRFVVTSQAGPLHPACFFLIFQLDACFLMAPVPPQGCSVGIGVAWR